MRSPPEEALSSESAPLLPRRRRPGVTLRSVGVRDRRPDTVFGGTFTGDAKDANDDEFNEFDEDGDEANEA